MNIEKATKIRLTAVSIGIAVTIAALLLITKRWEPILSVIFPGAALYWMILNERRLARKGYQFPKVGWSTKTTYFILFPALSLLLVIYAIPRFGTKLQGWVLSSGLSFSFGLLLVQLYERYLRTRARIATVTATDSHPAEVTQSSETPPVTEIGNSPSPGYLRLSAPARRTRLLQLVTWNGVGIAIIAVIATLLRQFEAIILPAGVLLLFAGSVFFLLGRRPRSGP